MPFGASRRCAHLITAVPREAFRELLTHLFGVYWAVTILIMVGPKVILVVAA